MSSTLRTNVLSPTADRDLMLCAVLGGFAAVATTVTATLMWAATATCRLVGRPATLPPADTWLRRVIRLLADPTSPAAAFGAPWADALDGHAGLYWSIAVATLLVSLAVTIGLLIAVWRAWGPTPLARVSRIVRS